MDFVDEAGNDIYNTIDVRFLSIENQLDELVDNFMAALLTVKNVKITKSAVLKPKVGVFHFLNNEFVEVKSTLLIEDYSKNDLQFFSGNSLKRTVYDMKELNRLIFCFNPTTEELKEEIYIKQIILRNDLLYILGQCTYHKRGRPDFTFRIYSQDCQVPEIIGIYDSRFKCTAFALDDKRVYFYSLAGVLRIYDFGLKNFIYASIKLSYIYSVFVTDKYLILQTRLDLCFYNKTDFVFSHKLRYAKTEDDRIMKCTFLNNFFIIVHAINQYKMRYRLISLEGEIKDKEIWFNEVLPIFYVEKGFYPINFVFFIEKDAIWLTNYKDQLLKIQF